MSLTVKICGLSTPDALDAALEAGADMVGFVFFEPSPRNVPLDLAAQLGKQKSGRAKKVALSVDADDDLLARIVATLEPDLLQLHGMESPERVSAIKARFGLPVIKALAVETKEDLAQTRSYASASNWLLFDAKGMADATRPGGLGKAFDWTLLRDAAPGAPFMLSGGLDAGNLAEALRITRAFGVDVSSGVERAPGEKDPDKIRRFVRAARVAAARLAGKPVTSST